ncbi:chaoptin isoform X5 [Ostrinia furnacalis]|uniref:chaoptin isoform X1 n=1 Tax=Ostrinia furnacalis TaxID=93504 RepID=UPI001039B2BA|nr:chaoptin isoform X1 [Ostrinia furnacalis]XP_028159953.1 chaoptin isoform X2 [Ostrinia furnacalis]XP_028159954.1 chaoptin isoform X3 [Ostrinia furnacalis]XP_028159955.1 chaoptin isoform X4 [Ostrinia furnacalis]XP_028159956.1 chaoptin isoform X5 [Ostrinia furnacalis]
MSFIKFGYALVVVTLLLMIWASLSRALELHVDTGHPSCLFQALCTCSKPAGDLGIVTCRHVPLLRVPATLNSSKVFTLQLTGNRIRELEPKFFQATGMYRLAINQNPLETIHEDAFYGLETTLWELELRYDGLTTVPSKSLRNLGKLRLLDLTGNEITDISSNDWSLGTLQTLILADNSIANLPIDAFSSLLMLETLDLRGNHLASVDGGVFRDGMNRLNKLLLGDNQLTFIPYEEVSPLRQLRVLDLSNNVIKQVPPVHETPTRLSLDILKLDNNVITELHPGSFKNFQVLNSTSLDGNPIHVLREDAFRNAKIKILSLRDCGIWDLSPAAFAGLENSLQSLDLSENNLTMISKFMLNKLDSLRFLNLRENKVDINTLATNTPTEYEVTSYNNFQHKLFSLDVSGASSIEMSLQDVRRMRSLRYLSVGKLIRKSIRAEDFLDFGVDLEDLKVYGSTINRIESSAFQHVRTIKTLDLSENEIDFIDPFAFAELHSLTTLKLANGLAETVKILPFEPLKALIELQHLDLSNNKLKNVPDTSFHFLYKLKSLNLQDNAIDHFSKGTLQGDIHHQLQSICLSLNQMNQIVQHTFVELKELQEILIEDNLIESIQRRAFTSLDNVKVIKLKGNRIYEIFDEAFQNIPALNELDISFNQLNTFRFSIFDQVGSAAALKVNVSHNRMVSLRDSNAHSFLYSSEFYQPKVQSLGIVSVNIRVMDFSHNNISEIAPYYFRHADFTLAELYLSHNLLRNITRDVFGSLAALQYLDLSHNQIYHMEYDCFARAKALQIIDLSHNYLTELPVQVFHEMPSLISLDLSNNRIRNLADNLIVSPLLERLDLSNNYLSRVPTNCFSPSTAANLVELDLSGNTIPAISMADFVQRYRTDQSDWQEEPDYSDEYMYHTARRDHTRVYHQKKQYHQNSLYKSLLSLDLSDNHLVRIEGNTFSVLPKLRWLDLSNNSPFNSGERGVSVFKGLERRLFHLGLKNVSLTTVPSMLLTKLKSLDLSYNNLPTIPLDTTANLTGLRKIDLSYNDLTTVPVAVQSLNDLRWLSLSGNPVTALMNNSLYGVSSRLEYLDVTKLKLRILEHGVFGKMYALRTLKISTSPDLREFNVPRMLAYNAALENLYVDVEYSPEFGQQMSAALPCKLNNITITGRSLVSLAPYLLFGVHSKVLRLTVFNTSIEEIESQTFWKPGRIRNLTLDLRSNYITKVSNPAQKDWPGVPNNMFLHDILISGNPLICDCGIGWIEAWDRKRRQYLCNSPFNCVATRDDVRFASCPLNDNRTLVDVMQRDLDCSYNKGFFSSPNLYIIIGMSFLTYLYI